LPVLIRKCIRMVTNCSAEVIFVDNGSTDGTRQIFLEYGVDSSKLKFLSTHRNLGYGGGIMFGLNRSVGQILGWTHADLQTDPADFLRASQFFAPESTSEFFVKGLRGGRSAKSQMLSVGLAVWASACYQLVLRDINAQPTVFTRRFYESWKSPPADFSLDIYAYRQAKLSGIKVIRVPVSFVQRRGGSSKWNTSLSSSARHIVRTAKYVWATRKAAT
jgi:glycosyltransferase involved in cell wall biosynthesis